MANLNFNTLEAFGNKCKTLQGFGYAFPYELDTDSYNDVDYDEQGRLYTMIKLYELVLVLDANEYTHILLAKYYKQSDAQSAKADLANDFVYDDTQFVIQETTERIYEDTINGLIDTENDKAADEATNFDVVQSNVGNVYEFKILGEVDSSDSTGNPVYRDIDLYDWILISYGETTVDVGGLNETTFRSSADGKSVILEASDNVLHKVIVHKLLSESDDYESKIEYATILYNV